MCKRAVGYSKVFYFSFFPWLRLAVHPCAGGENEPVLLLFFFFANQTRRWLQQPTRFIVLFQVFLYSGHLVYYYNNILHVVLTIILCITLNFKTVRH